MATTSTIPPLVAQKLAAFEQLRSEFENSFRFVQAVHGQQRFTEFPVSSTVRYLHALWICECKDRLLSIPKTIRRYEGLHCLELLRGWLDDDLGTASVVAFLHRKLDTLPFADLTRQLHIARQHPQGKALALRLAHGREVLLNRGMNLLQALDAIFALSDEELLLEVRVTSEALGHTPEQIEEQIAAMKTLPYSYIPHQVLAQHNIRLMNKLGVDMMSEPTDRPQERTEQMEQGRNPKAPYAERVIVGYQEMTSTTRNNMRGPLFNESPERDSRVEK